ncbi:MAG: hypothetical protein AAGI14_11415 [Pseudomonadota bacterium]
MLIKTSIAAALCLAGANNAFAQNDRLETIVVTGSMIDEDDLGEIPNVTLRVNADFILYELTYVNSTLEPSERKDEMERMYNAVRRELPKHPTLKLKVGDASASADIETTIFDEAYNNYGTQARMDFVVSADVQSNDSYQDIRERVEAFVDQAGEIGRSQSILDDEQYLGVNDLKSYRPALIKAIWDDIYATSNPSGITELEIKGLEGRTQYIPVGPMELQLFIPYKVEYATTVDR